MSGYRLAATLGVPILRNRDPALLLLIRLTRLLHHLDLCLGDIVERSIRDCEFKAVGAGDRGLKERYHLELGIETYGGSTRLNPTVSQALTIGICALPPVEDHAAAHPCPFIHR